MRFMTCSDLFDVDIDKSLLNSFEATLEAPRQVARVLSFCFFIGANGVFSPLRGVPASGATLNPFEQPP